MAEGETPHPLGPGQRRRRFDRHLSRDDISNQARVLLSQYIHERMEADGLENTPDSDELVNPDTPTGPPVDGIREVADCLRRIGDELDGDERIQRLIREIPPDAPSMTFQRVAEQIFSDGIFNWGRVVALFYFAYKLAVKAIGRIHLIRSVIEWVVRFIRDSVAPWIIGRGGWEAIPEYFGTPTMQALGVLLSGVLLSVLTAAFVYWRSSR